MKDTAADHKTLCPLLHYLPGHIITHHKREKEKGINIQHRLFGH